MTILNNIDSPLLKGYVASWLKNPTAIPLSVFQGVNFVGDFAQIVLDRDGQFQSQLCLCKPNANTNDHAHPNVEQLLIYVTGMIVLRLNGEDAYPMANVGEKDDGTCTHNAYGLYIGSGVSHGAVVGPTGGAFITLQHWLKGEPTSVEHDWDGPALSDEHIQNVKGVK